MSNIELETQLRSSYKWVLELAGQKAIKFPCLEKVTLIENITGSFVEWAYPEDLLKAFEAAKINLVVRPSLDWV
jgi:hypothetical protein